MDDYGRAIKYEYVLENVPFVMHCIGEMSGILIVDVISVRGTIYNLKDVLSAGVYKQLTRMASEEWLDFVESVTKVGGTSND